MKLQTETTDFQKKENSSEGVCPCCGYCKHCGRRNTQPWPYTQPFQPLPYYPSPYTGDWTITTTPDISSWVYNESGNNGIS